MNTMNVVTVQTVSAHNMEFECRMIGDPTSKKAVILLHGWPETSHMWIPLMEKLHKEGYFCVAPNMRGYSEGARPKGKQFYGLVDLASDIVALAGALDINEKFQLIGHDWGSAVGWGVLGLVPERVNSFVALSVPHILSFADAIKDDPKQKAKSRYIQFFQLPYVPELALSAMDYRLLRKYCWKRSSAEQIEDYLTVFGDKKALTATLHYYRKNLEFLQSGAPGLKLKKLKVPTMLIWGNRDVAIGRAAVEGAESYMAGDYELVELDAGHWLMQQAPDAVWDAVKKHFDKNPIELPAPSETTEEE